MPEPGEVRKGITRRDMLRRGAVVGGLLWTAPVIQSITSPAYAVSEAFHACCQCNDAFPWPALVDGVTCQDCQDFCTGHGGVKIYRKGTLCSATNAVCDDLDTCPQDCSCLPQSSCP